MLARLNWLVALLAAAGAAVVVASQTGAVPLGRAANVVGIVSILASIAVRAPLKVWSFPAVINWLMVVVSAGGAGLVTAAATGTVHVGTSVVGWINLAAILAGVVVRMPFGTPPPPAPPEDPPPSMPPGPPAFAA